MNKILIIKLSSLGDILQATPAISAIRKKNLNSEITMVVNKNCYNIIKNNLEIDKFILAENIGITNNLVIEFMKIVNLLLKIRKEKYDICYIFHRNKILLKICQIAGIKNIKIFGDINQKKGNIEFIEFNQNIHRIYRNLKLVDSENYLEYNPKIKYYISNKISDKIVEFCKENKYIIIAPGGGKNVWAEMKSRCWSEENYKKLIEELSKVNKIVLIGGKDDKSLCEKLKINENVYDFSEKTTIDETAYLIKNSMLFVGNDSMNLFLAGAFEIKLIGLFGPTNGKVINPIGENFKYIQANIECSPCYNPVEGLKGKAYKCRDIKCMRYGIKVEEVLNLTNELLKI